MRTEDQSPGRENSGSETNRFTPATNGTLASKVQLRDSRDVGEIGKPSAIAEICSPICGAILRLTLRADPGSQRIQEIKYKVIGCTFLVDLASNVAGMLKDIRIGEAARLKESDITGKLGAAPSDKKHCVKLCLDALRELAINYRNATLDEWHGEDALICTCFGVSERSIEAAVRARGLRTVSEVTMECNAGGGCGSCQPLIVDMLSDYWGHERWHEVPA